jgi:lysophospholipase L1-like esterase/uncharacterized metal-binding protein
LLYHYPGASNIGEGFQFNGSGGTATAFIMCYPPKFQDLGGAYTQGVWQFQADVYTNVAGTVTRRTYISPTAGATPTLIGTETWTVSESPDAPDYFDIGEARGWARTLRGTFEYVGLAEVAMSTAQLAAQSNSATPTISCWVFVSGESGTYVDSSGNSRTIILTGGPPTASSVEAPLTLNDASAALDVGLSVSGSLAGVGSLVADIAVAIAVDGSLGSPGTAVASAAIGLDMSGALEAVGQLSADVTIGVTMSGAMLAGVASAQCDIGLAMSGVLSGIGSVSAATTIGIDASGVIVDVLPRVICYGNSVTAGYGISDPALHYPAQLKLLLGDRVEQVIELGFSGQTTDTLDADFAANVGPSIDPTRRNIVIWQEVFNSAHAGVAAPTIMSAYWSVCAKARAAGCEVIAQDTSAADLDSQSHPEIVATCNDAQESQWGANADGFVKISDTFYDPTDTYLYQADGAHFTAAGLQVLASLNYVEVDRLLLGGSFVAHLVAPITAGVDVVGVASGSGNLHADCSMSIDASGVIIGPGSHGDCDVTFSVAGVLSSVGEMVANVAINLGFAGSFLLPTLTENAGAKYRAARSVSVAAGDVLEIPQWVRAFIAFAPCQVLLRDRAGVALSAAIGGESLRPSIAASMTVVVPGVVLFLY